MLKININKTIYATMSYQKVLPGYLPIKKLLTPSNGQSLTLSF